MANHCTRFLVLAAVSLLLSPSLRALEVEFDWSCEKPIIQMKDGKPKGGEDKDITITGLTRTEVIYSISIDGRPSPPLPVRLDKVASICFGNSTRSFDAAREAYDARDYAAAAPQFEAAAKERGPAAVWMVQLGLYYAGRCYMELGRTADAGRMFDELMATNSDNVFASDIVLDQIRIKARQGAAGVAEAVRLIDSVLGDRGLPMGERFELQFLKGELLESIKKLSEAMEAFKDAESTAGRMPSGESEKARLRCSLAQARVKLGQGDLSGARAQATRVLASTSHDKAEEHEARAFAYNLEGDCFLADAEGQAGNPAKVRELLESALERYLRVVAVYGADDAVAPSIRQHAFARAQELAGKNRLNLRDVEGSTAAKAASCGF